MERKIYINLILVLLAGFTISGCASIQSTKASSILVTDKLPAKSCRFLENLDLSTSGINSSISQLHEGQLDSMRSEAARLGANVIVLGGMKSDSSGRFIKERGYTQTTEHEMVAKAYKCSMVH